MTGGGGLDKLDRRGSAGLDKLDRRHQVERGLDEVEERSRKRNVVMIISDDQGAWALGAAGNPEIHTPHLDAMAAAGVRWSAMHCASPVCSPARASLLTGVPPTVHGVVDWIAPDSADADTAAPRYLDGTATYVERLSAAGLRTIMIGKWHLGDASAPTAGFDEWFALEASHGPYQDAPFVASPSLQHLRTDGYVTDRIADAAIDVITRADGPFHVHVAFTAPHHPWVDQHPDEWTDHYADCAFDSCPVEPPHPWQHPQLAPAVAAALQDPRPSLIGYFAAVSAMDAAIGRILEVIDLDTTLVVFTSDNGYACGQHGLWGKGNATLPLNLLDTSVLVPMIALGLAGGRPGEVRDTPVSHLDLHPTVLAAIGLPTDDTRPGRDLAAPRGDDPVVITDEYGAARAIRTDRWTLITRDDGPWQLFDHAADPDQRHDRIGDLALHEVRDEQADRLEQWYARWAAGPYDPRTAGVTGRGQRRLMPAAGSRRG